MRHGHKSRSTRFKGYKAALVVDTDSQLITAVEVLPGNAPDNTGVRALVKQSKENTGMEVEETIGDAAYGDGATRQARYFGRVKTLFQLLLAATVANLTLVATKMGMMYKANRQATSFLRLFYRHSITVAKVFAIGPRTVLKTIISQRQSIQNTFLCRWAFRLNI